MTRVTEYEDMLGSVTRHSGTLTGNLAGGRRSQRE